MRSGGSVIKVGEKAAGRELFQTPDTSGKFLSPAVLVLESARDFRVPAPSHQPPSPSRARGKGRAQVTGRICWPERETNGRDRSLVGEGRGLESRAGAGSWDRGLRVGGEVGVEAPGGEWRVGAQQLPGPRA
ncbi:hypothetical protein J1605_016608 [Eschrichtius robustus]|uniref:Uncharacterized protein n=1 Tax=Eschrichtius robustus TaxID=9764 RepID=A0AB34I5K2_ESCRO|nr:hypothetical protein J1605_016608 [Eschrichtius robustus]